ncbi:MAG: PilN domain-containing protein [Acidobacteriota bacterium]|nr:MAG: PilN domain-containing protein [Acidobacteriota bacterium]
MIRINLLGVSKEALKEMAAPAVGVAEKVAGLEKFKIPIIAAVAVVALLYLAGRWHSLSSQISQLNDDIAQEEERKRHLEEIAKKAKAFEESKQQLENKIKVISDLKNSQQTPVYILDEVSQQLDDYVWIADMKLAGMSLSLKAKAFTLIAMTNFIHNLDESPYIKGVNLKSANERSGLINFALDCTLKMTRPTQTPEAEAEEAS